MFLSYGIPLDGGGQNAENSRLVKRCQRSQLAKANK